jgi:hypothetical protein
VPGPVREAYAHRRRDLVVHCDPQVSRIEDPQPAVPLPIVDPSRSPSAGVQPPRQREADQVVSTEAADLDAAGGIAPGLEGDAGARDIGLPGLVGGSVDRGA